MEKRLWREVIKTACGGSSNPSSNSNRTVQQYYAKLLLPYECHLNNLDISTCLMKPENSVSRRTSLSSPCSQLSTDSDSKERANHLSEVSKFEGTNSLEGRVNGETMCVMPGSTLLDGEHVVKRVNSQDPNNNSSSTHLTNSTGIADAAHRQPQQRATPQDRTPTHPTKVSNSYNHNEEHGLGVGGFSEDSQGSYSQAAALAEPLPEMSVQDAESVLGMSPTPFPAGQEGPTTPSAGVPSPTHFPPGHFPPQQQQQQTVANAPPPGTPTGSRGAAAGGSQDYSTEMTEMGRASTPGLGSSSAVVTPSSYPPPYPDMPGYLPPYGPGNYPPYNSYHRQYDIPPDYHPGMPAHMMRPSYPASQYSGMPHGGHRPMDYPGQYSSHLMHSMGGMQDPSMYPSGHGMSSEWHWQQQQHHHQQQQQRQQQMMSSFPSHLQQSQMYHRMQQHHQQQQAMNAMRHQQQQAAMAAALQQRGSPGTPTSGSPGGMMDHKLSWQDQNSVAAMAHKNLHQVHYHHSEKALTSPKPQMKHHLLPEVDGKVQPAGKAGGLTSEAAKRSHPDWSNCVEGTKPQLIKRRKLYSIHCGEP